MSAAWRRSRFTNALRGYASYALSRLCSVHISHEPLFVSVEPASVCQLRCPECPVAFSNRTALTDRPAVIGAADASALPKNQRFPGTPYMTAEVWQRTLEEIKPFVHTVQFFFQGEPLLHPRLSHMIAEAHAEGLYTIVSTNAQAMTQEMAEALVRAGLSRIIVSMDGLTQETYSAYRIGGDIELCYQALRWLREAKERLHAHTTIELQCLRLKTNEHEWATLRRQYKALGADCLTLKTAQLYDYTHGHPLMPSNPRYSRYRQLKDGLYHRKPLGKGCWRVWSGCVITTTGDVLPCCYDKAHAHAYGNIMNAHLRELFNNAKAQAFRRAAMSEQPAICKECWR